MPDQSLLPWMVGLGGGLPRSVPQDAVVAVLTGPGAGVGVGDGRRWSPPSCCSVPGRRGCSRRRHGHPGRGSGRRRVVAVRRRATAARPLVAPARRGGAALGPGRRRRRAGGPAGRRCALAAVGGARLAHPTGGLLVLAVTLRCCCGRPRSRARRRALALLGGAALQLPWVVPSLLHPAAVGADGVDVFALRPEGPWGAVLTALGTGGVWNTDAVPAAGGRSSPRWRRCCCWRWPSRVGGRWSRCSAGRWR